MHRRSTIVLATFWLCLHTGSAQSPGQFGPNQSRLIAAAIYSGSNRGAQASPAQDSAGIAGDWNGTLEVLGQKLRLVLRIKKNADGKLTGTLDSLDQGANDIPIAHVDQAGADVKLELSGIAADYQGKLDGTGTEISGAWKQNGGTLPVVFNRAIDKTYGDLKPSKGLPATLAGFEDQANFTLFLNGQRLTMMESTWKKNGSFEGHAAINLAGEKTETTTRIVPAADGRWARITLESALGLVMLTRQGSIVTHMFKRKKNTWETREGLVLFDNNSPALISQALRRYDRKKGGVQKFPLLILPDTLAELTVEAKRTTVYKIAGKNRTLTKFLYGLPGMDIYAWADAEGKVYLVNVPAQKAAFVREGYEALRKVEVSDAFHSAPRKAGRDERDRIGDMAPCCQ
jgi:hypothetical protein